MATATLENTTPSSKPKTVLGLRCRECGQQYDIAPVHICELCFGPLEVIYDYDEIGKRVSRASIQDGPLTMWRYEGLLPLDGPPTVGRQVGFTPLGPRRKPRQGTRRPRGLHQKRRRQPSHALVQGPRSRRRFVQSARVRLRYRRLRLHRQFGELRRRPCRRRQVQVLHLHPARSGAGKSDRHPRLRLDGSLSQRQLRRSEPPLLGSGRQVRLGTRQRQPAPVLRRRLQDLRLRNRRAAWTGKPRSTSSAPRRAAR